MYLAPLNYDRFFKKVFSDLEIAKAFIEDFLDVEIEMIESLDTTQRFTDNSAIVEFDYRCRINGHYIIIDMQQWYKPDVVQRFFLYHSLNTGLQLEGLPVKTIELDKVTKRSKNIKDYRLVEPVFTLIWMVHDKLGFEDNFISYKLYPSTVEEFLKDKTLWKNREIQKIVEERENVLKQITNDTKELDFLPKNSLTFMFQQNIINDTRLSKYI
ncbi:MAG: hypothetical protein GY804_11895, partial [Alphaproteobacteria bacterium]|nr:hypothetical protein [Alphaproteobacteria bacterium]